MDDETSSQEDGSDAAALAATQKAKSYVGQILGGRFQVEDIVALGGMGAVFRAWHVHMRKHVALKLLHPATENLPELVARFERESIVDAHVKHENVCSAADFGSFDDGSHYLVLEYVEGRTLKEILRDGPMMPERATDIARQMAGGLGAAHELGIYHRDVKPSNVMLADGPRTLVKIIDFGLAKLPANLLTRGQGDDLRVTASGTVFGTVAYMAPELARGMHVVDHRSDLYALGVILYEMLAGAHPFDAVEPTALFRQHRMQRPPPFAERAPSLVVPPELEAITLKLLEKNPNARYQSADEVIDDLDDVYPPPEFQAPPAGRSSRRTLPSFHDRGSRSDDSSSRRASRSLLRPIPPPDPADASPAPMMAEREESPKEDNQRGRKIVRNLLMVLALGLGVLGGMRRFYPEQYAKLGLEPGAKPKPAATATASATAEASSEPSVEASAPEPQRAAIPVTPEISRLRSILHEAAAARDNKRGTEALYALAKSAPEQFVLPEVVASAAALAVNVDTGDRAMVEPVFQVLESPELGAGGPDVLFHVASFYGGSRSAARATEGLAKKEVLARASRGLVVARELRATACKERPGLYDRAVTEGDERSLALLIGMRRADCQSSAGQCCAPADVALAHAVAKLKERLRK